MKSSVKSQMSFDMPQKSTKHNQGEHAPLVAYRGRHAELYDLFYADKPYVAEALFVHERLADHGGPPMRRILDLACGTGSHALAFEKHGYEVVAVDSSPDMLTRARQKAADTGASVEFIEQDMRGLALSAGHFDAVVCLFDSLGYAVSNNALADVLRSVHRHLRPEGMFVLEFWHAAAMLRHYDPLRIRRWTLPDSEVTRISETTLDVAQQTASVTYTIHEIGANGICTHLTETQTNRYFLLQEMAWMLESCGFTPVGWYPGFSTAGQINDETWHIIGVGQKPK